MANSDQQDSIYKMECNLCDEQYSLEELFKCMHKDCANNKKVYCKDCGKHYHKKKSHSLLIQTDDAEDINLNTKYQQNKPEIMTVDEEEEEEKKPNQDIVTEEKKEPSLELELYGIKCEEISCGKAFDPEDVFICKHIECTDDCSIYCYDCNTFKHRNKKHRFGRNERYVKSVKDLYEPDQNKFDDAKQKAKILVDVSQVEKFLFHHRWTLGIGMTASMGGVIGTSTLFNGAPTVAAACGIGGSVLTTGLVAGALGGVGGCVISSVIEGVFIWRQYSLERISGEEALALTGVSFASNAAAGLGFFGVMAIGAAAGTPGGPVGVVVGVTIAAIVAGVLFGFGTRWALNKKFEKHFKNKHEFDLKLQQQALEYFFNDKNLDIDDENKFNDKVLRRTYHRLTLICHPDRHDGDQEEWLKLSAYYGVLIGIWEKKQEVKDKSITNSDDLDEEKRSLILNSSIKNYAHVTTQMEPNIHVNPNGNETEQ